MGCVPIIHMYILYTYINDFTYKVIYDSMIDT